MLFTSLQLTKELFTHSIVDLDDRRYDNVIESLIKLVNQLPNKDVAYSNPKGEPLTLPFLYPGKKKPADRFKLDNDALTFKYMGRVGFSTLLKDIEDGHNRGYTATMIFGTIGYGKSHILAAMACYYHQKGRKVVYIPDCHSLIEDPLDYLKSAFYLTFHNDDENQHQIAQCSTLENIETFCSYYKGCLLFIIDQWNALDGDNDIKSHLEHVVFRHYLIMAASANTKTMVEYDEHKQLNINLIKMYGGLTQVH